MNSALKIEAAYVCFKDFRSLFFLSKISLGYPPGFTLKTNSIKNDIYVTEIKLSGCKTLLEDKMTQNKIIKTSFWWNPFFDWPLKGTQWKNARLCQIWSDYHQIFLQQNPNYNRLKFSKSTIIWFFNKKNLLILV